MIILDRNVTCEGQSLYAGQNVDGVLSKSATDDLLKCGWAHKEVKQDDPDNPESNEASEQSEQGSDNPESGESSESDESVEVDSLKELDQVKAKATTRSRSKKAD